VSVATGTVAPLAGLAIVTIRPALPVAFVAAGA
jgi:hypothetical protein